jgi:hypothetical protein
MKSKIKLNKKFKKAQKNLKQKTINIKKPYLK